MLDSGSKRLLVLVPAFNEQAAIRAVVLGIRAEVPYATVLVVDDGSRDATAREAQDAGALVVRHPFNLGIGATVQTGLKYARLRGYDLVVRVDGDGQHDQAGIASLCTALQTHQVDAVFGSRFMGTRALMQIPIARRLGIFCFAAIVTVLTGQRTTDATSGFFCLNRRAVDVLAELMPQDYPEVESRVVLHKAGLRVREIPARMLARRTGISSIDTWRSVYYAFKVSVAALITALKDVPAYAKARTAQAPTGKEYHHDDTPRPAGVGAGIQRSPARGDRAVDP
jgi:glycosyltransferase involved in cell wall biosynthesis